MRPFVLFYSTSEGLQKRPSDVFIREEKMSFIDYMGALPVFINFLILNMVIVSLVQKRVHRWLSEEIQFILDQKHDTSIKLPGRNIVAIIRFSREAARLNRDIMDKNIFSLLLRYRLFWIYSYISALTCMLSFLYIAQF